MNSEHHRLISNIYRDISEFRESLRKEIQHQINSHLTDIYGYPPGKNTKGKSPDLNKLTKLYLTMLDLELL